MRRQFNGIEVRQAGPLWAVRFERDTRWGLIGHPLWDAEALDGSLGEAVAALLALCEGIIVGTMVWLLRELYFRLRKFQGLGTGGPGSHAKFSSFLRRKTHLKLRPRVTDLLFGSSEAAQK